MTLPNWARDPLVHFLAAGFALFLVFAWQGEPADPASRTIEVGREQQAQLALQWERTMGRPPTDAELATMVDQWVREEILYREALRLGLDADDAVLRRRLAQKMDFLAASAAEAEQPSDAELERWRTEHAARFTPDQRLSLDQLWFDDRADAAAALERVGAAGDWHALGDSIDLPPSLEDVSRSSLESRFGRSFADAVDGIEVGKGWQGPFESGFGFHLIRVRERRAGSTPPLADIREDVENDWRAATIADRQEKSFALLKDAYTIRIDR